MNNERIESFQNRLREGMRIREINAAELARKTGYKEANISQWVNGKYEAKQEGVYKLANTLNVNEAWLMGYDVPMERSTFEVFDEDVANVSLLKYEVQLVEQIQKHFGKNAVQMLQSFTELNQTGQEKVLENIHDISELPRYTNTEPQRTAQATTPKITRRKRRTASDDSKED